MARFQFFPGHRRQTDGQNRLLNPASRMRARGNYLLWGVDFTVSLVTTELVVVLVF